MKLGTDVPRNNTHMSIQSRIFLVLNTYSVMPLFDLGMCQNASVYSIQKVMWYK